MRIQIPEAFSGLFKPARYKAFYGGRGSGKSWAVATALVLMAAQRPMRVLCCREIQKSIKESVKSILEARIEAMQLGGLFQSLETEIRCVNGSLFMFAGLRSNPDSIKSMDALDVAWVEEASRVSQRSLELLVPTLRKEGSELWFTWNPERPDDPVDALFRGPGGPPPGSLVRRVNWYDNPFFPDELRREMEWMRERDPDKCAHIYGGEYDRKSEARVFRNWRVEPFETPADAVFRFGADWGFAQDPTVLVRCFVKGRTLFVDYEASKVGCEIDHTPQLFRSVPGADKGIIRADSARPETVSYMRRHGFNIVPALKGHGSLEDGVAFLQSFDIVVHPRCKAVEKELTFYSYKVDEHTGDILSVLEDKNNHTIDALRYALEELRRSGFTASPNAPRNRGDRWARAIDRLDEGVEDWKAM